jgi:hypothetical protein
MYKNNIAIAEAKILGIRPVLWHHFGPEAISLEKKELTGKAGNDPGEWKNTVLITEEKQLYFESTYIFSCIREGARYTKRGRSTLQSIISATLQVMDEKILIDRFLPEEITTNSNEPVYLDVRGVKNPSTKGRNVRYRVCSTPGWRAKFCVSWDLSIIGRNEMEAVVIDAGMFAGLGDGRSMGFGRFELEEFKVSKNAQKEAI